MLKTMPIFIAVISFAIVSRILLRKSDNGYDKAIDDFIDRENKANSTIKDFNSLNIEFVKPCKTLPFKEYEDISIYKNVIKKQNILKRRVDLEMIKIPSNLTNTELKEKYGLNNFDKIYKLEDNYNSYVRGLFEWAVELYNLDNLYDCEKVLLEAYRLEANIHSVYTLLAKIYLKQNNKTKLINLKQNVLNIELSLKDKTIKEIDEYINNIL